MSGEEIAAAVVRMKSWANDHGECDTQGVMDDEWVSLARAALNDDGWDADEAY